MDFVECLRPRDPPTIIDVGDAWLLRGVAYIGSIFEYPCDRWNAGPSYIGPYTGSMIVPSLVSVGDPTSAYEPEFLDIGLSGSGVLRRIIRRFFSYWHCLYKHL